MKIRLTSLYSVAGVGAMPLSDALAIAFEDSPIENPEKISKIICGIAALLVENGVLGLEEVSKVFEMDYIKLREED